MLIVIKDFDPDIRGSRRSILSVQRLLQGQFLYDVPQNVLTKIGGLRMRAMDRHGQQESDYAVNRDARVSLVFLAILLSRTGEESQGVNEQVRSKLPCHQSVSWDGIFDNYLPSSSAFSY